jgi:hypothetical protein
VTANELGDVERRQQAVRQLAKGRRSQLLAVHVRLGSGDGSISKWRFIRTSQTSDQRLMVFGERCSAALGAPAGLTGGRLGYAQNDGGRV